MSYVNDYHENGLTKCDEGLSKKEVEIINAEIEKICQNPKSKGLIFEKDGVTPRSLANPQFLSPVFDALVGHPMILNYAKEVIEDDVYVFQLGVNIKAPFKGDIWFWHRDYPTYCFEDNIPTPRMVNVLIYLDEATSLNGALMYVPTSHKESYEKTEISSMGTSHPIRYEDQTGLEESIQNNGIEQVQGKAGDIFLLNTNTIHGSGANLSPYPRRLITLTYNAITNKSTAPSRRSRDIVMDDTSVSAVKALDKNCLFQAECQTKEKYG